MVSYTMPVFFRPLFSFLVCFAVSVAGAQKEKRRTEGPSDLIEKARNLSLQKDRAQAVNILVNAMKREPVQSAGFREMRQALDEISKIFLSDRAQQQYELGLSLRKTDPRQAQARFQEALRMEPENLQIVNELARLQLSQGECEAAHESLTQARRTNPYDEQSLLTSAQAAVCLNDWPLYTSLRSQAEGRRGAYKKNWVSLEAERAYRENSETRLQEAVQAMKNLVPDHPELSFWEWHFAKTPEKKNEAAAQYLNHCKSLSTATLRKFLAEPFLCKKTNEVEKGQKAGANP